MRSYDVLLVKPDEFGSKIGDFIKSEENKPRKINERTIEAEIIEIDRFGNLITNLKRADLPLEFVLKVGEIEITKLQNYFAEAEKSEIFMIFGSAGFLEIIAFQASAEEILRAESGQKLKVIV